MEPWSVFSVLLIDKREGIIVFSVTGDNAYEKFKHESGGLRWQRIPPTENKGRYHTSTITVAVFKSNEKRAISVKESDLEWKFCRGKGKGGQNRNKRDTAVWLKHQPSGIQIRSEEERTQHANKTIALKRLEDKLNSINDSKNKSKYDVNRKAQHGTGERGDKIRTIRVRDNVVTNHLSGNKIKYTNYIKGKWDGLFE